MTKPTHDRWAPSDPLDQVHFVLSDQQTKEFDELIAAAWGPNEALRELIAQSPPWEASRG